MERVLRPICLLLDWPVGQFKERGLCKKMARPLSLRAYAVNSTYNPRMTLTRAREDIIGAPSGCITHWAETAESAL